jgi:hypothetical protein
MFGNHCWDYTYAMAHSGVLLRKRILAQARVNSGIFAPAVNPID